MWMPDDRALAQLAELDPPEGEFLLPAWVSNVSTNMPVEELVELVATRNVRIAFPDRAEDEDFLKHLYTSVRENVVALQNVICGPLPMTQLRLGGAELFAAFQAEAGIPQTSLQRSYRVGFYVLWHEWTWRLRQTAEEMDVPREEAMSAITRVTQTILSYQHHVASLVAETYSNAEDLLRESNDHVRQRLVREILHERAGSLSRSDLVIIGYDLNAWHLAILFPTTSESGAQARIQQLRGELAIRQTLTHPLTLNSSVTWFGRGCAWEPATVSQVMSVLREERICASLGGTAQGVDGFRDAYLQARDVETVRRVLSPTSAGEVLAHADVALEVLLMQNVRLATAFVERELGDLASDAPENRRLCETLEVSYAMDSHTSAAVVLKIHEHTVRNRLRRVEELIGHSIGERRTDLQVALRLRRLVHPDVSDTCA